MGSLITSGQLAPERNNEHHKLPAFAFPMMVLFGTYAVWIVVASLILLVLNVF